MDVGRLTVCNYCQSSVIKKKDRSLIGSLRLMVDVIMLRHSNDLGINTDKNHCKVLIRSQNLVNRT